MILRYSDNKLNTKTRTIFKCDRCYKEDDRLMVSHTKLLNENPDFDKDYCKKCWNEIRQKTDRSRNRMSKSINKMMKDDPDWKVRNSKSKKGKINLGSSNGMTKEENKKKVSESRKKIMTPEFRKNISEYTAKAWKDGKYDGVKVGQCKWFEYHHSNGNIYKVQGTWELAFIEWLDESNMDFDCHKGRLPYQVNGETRSYYPDFFVNEWNSYVDIKNEYHYGLQKEKFNAIIDSGIKVKLILKEELESLINRKL